MLWRLEDRRAGHYEMRTVWRIGLLVVVLECGIARAEFSPSAPTPEAAPAAIALGQLSAPQVAGRPWAPVGAAGSPTDPIRWVLDQRCPAGSLSTTQQDEVPVLELPDGPSGLALGLSALASLGAFQGGRSLRKLQFGTLPDWYHPYAVQIGHTTPWDLQFGPMAVCLFEAPSDLLPRNSYRLPREPVSRYRSEFSLITESPRAPPLAA